MAKALRFRFWVALGAIAALTFVLAACGGGSKAPDFTLADPARGNVSLTDLQEGNEAVVLIFYRGHF